MSPRPNDRGAFFALGGVIPPADVPRTSPVLPRAEHEPFARFRFVMGPECGWLFPIGHFSPTWWRVFPGRPILPQGTTTGAAQCSCLRPKQK